MTLPVETTRIEYTGNGVLDTYPYTFRILDRAHLGVYVDGSLMVEGLHYTVTGVGIVTGGNVVFEAAYIPASASSIVILRDVPFTQETDYFTGVGLDEETIENDIDKMVMLAQQLKEIFDRCPKFAASSLFKDIAFPELVASRFLTANAGADGLAFVAGTPFTAPTYPNGDPLLMVHYYDCRQWASINAAIAAIGVEEACLIVGNEQTLAANFAPPANIRLEFVYPGHIKKDLTYTIDLQLCKMNDPYWQIFEGFDAGDVTGLEFARPEWWGGAADSDGTTGNGTDNYAAFTAAYAAVPDTGAAVKIKRGIYRTGTKILHPVLKSLEGVLKGWPTIYSLFGITPIGTSIFGDGCDAMEVPAILVGGYSSIKNVNFMGSSGGHIGLKVLSMDVHLENVSAVGFLDGVGIWFNDWYTGTARNINVQNCGLGMYLGSNFNANDISGLVIGNCSCGIYGYSGSQSFKIQGAIQSCESGIAGTSFPGVGLLTVAPAVLTDLMAGGAQETLEGGAIVGYSYSGEWQIYFEKNSGVDVYLGIYSVGNLRGCKFNDILSTRKNEFVNIRAANKVCIENNNFITTHARGHALIDLDSTKPHKVVRNEMTGAVNEDYTGTVYEDTVNAAVKYSSRSILQKADGSLYCVRTMKTSNPWVQIASVGGALAIDMSLGKVFIVPALQEDTLVGLPTNPEDGDELEIHFIQDAVGGWDVTWHNNFYNDVWSDVGNAALKQSSIKWRYRSSAGYWYQAESQKTYA